MAMATLKVSDVSCRYGAPMGRRNILPDDCDEAVKLQMVKLQWVDGDYDEGGAYWGGGSGDSIYFASGENDEIVIEVYVRARNRTAAKAKVRRLLPNAKFYR